MQQMRVNETFIVADITKDDAAFLTAVYSQATRLT